MTDDIVKEARECFELCTEAEKDNREAALDDIKFARLGEQWPEEVKRERENKGRPCLTINKLPSYIRQVVNDARQNKPSIRVRPADDDSDLETAEIISGLIRNIEYTSNADVAYDTAIESSVSCGMGYLRVNIQYAHDDTFDLDLCIDRVSNPFSVYGDPFSTAADSSDWNMAFIVDKLKKKDFEKQYKGAEEIDWEALDGYNELQSPWKADDIILLAEYWTREEINRPIVLLNNGDIIDAKQYKDNQDIFQTLGLQVIQERTVKSWKVSQRIMSGAEVLEENAWAGKYIPIIPVYGEEVNVEGKRYFRSMVRDAKDPQRMLNYWRSASTELVALAPKAPFIGKKGAFATDASKWATANTETHAYIQYDGQEAPQRQPFAGVPAGALQEAMNAADDMKAVMGMFDASMGAQGNETSGKAIIARQRESDNGTFQYIDNLARAIRHTGRILVDLIPHVYSGERIIRILGEDGKVPKNIQIGQQQAQQPQQEAPDEQNEQENQDRVYNLTVGKYDVVVDTGPSYATKREEAAEQMTELMRVYPQGAPLMADLLAKNLDWPGADDIAARFKAMLPPQVNGGNPEAQALQQQIQQVQQQAMQQIQELQGQLQQTTQQAETIKNDKTIEAKGLEIEAYNAETNRLKVIQAAGMSQQEIQAIVLQTVQQMMTAPDITQDDKPPDTPPDLQQPTQPPSGGFFSPSDQQQITNPPE